MPASDDISAERVSIDNREHELLYKLFLEALVVQSKGVREFNRLPPGMRFAIVELIRLYGDLPNGRAIAFDPATGSFVGNRAQERFFERKPAAPPLSPREEP